MPRAKELLFSCTGGGGEESPWPTPEKMSMARMIIDLGADILIGHHAHCVRPVEKYNGKTIAYGLGNAVFDNLKAPRNYSDEGRPTRYYKKTQHGWNRSSIGLSIRKESMYSDV